MEALGSQMKSAGKIFEEKRKVTQKIHLQLKRAEYNKNHLNH